MCRLERDRKAVIGLVEAAKQRLPQARVRRVQQEYKKRFVSLSRKDKQSGESHYSHSRHQFCHFGSRLHASSDLSGINTGMFCNFTCGSGRVTA